MEKTHHLREWDGGIHGVLGEVDNKLSCRREVRRVRGDKEITDYMWIKR